jgi:hypothetical protein
MHALANASTGENTDRLCAGPFRVILMAMEQKSSVMKLPGRVR